MTDTTEKQLADFQQERDGHIERVRDLDTEIEWYRSAYLGWPPSMMKYAKLGLTMDRDS